MVEPVNNSVGMGLPMSPAEYPGNPPGGYEPQPQPQPQPQPPPPSHAMNGGMPAYAGVEPIPPVAVTSFELELNSGDLYPLGPPWEGNLSEQMSSNLTLSETGPS